MHDYSPLIRNLSIITRTHWIDMNDRLRPHGLSAGQVPFLLFLAGEPNVTQEALARHFHLDKGTVARAVRRLEDGGFVRRTPDPASRRAIRLFLTEQGVALVPEIRRIDRAWEDDVCTGLSGEERAVLSGLLAGLAERSLDRLRARRGGDA